MIEIGLISFLIASSIIGSVIWFISFVYFSRQIRKQTQKMVQLMKADEEKLARPDDVFNSESDLFSDLERASYTLRRKYLRLKKNSQDEKSVFETVFSGLEEAIVTVDPQLKIISFNSAFMKMFNWSPDPQLVLGQHYYLHDVVRAPEVLENFKKTFNHQETLKNEYKGYRLFISLLPTVEDHEKWALGVFYDLSEIQKTEKIRVDFVANASHELRTPLTVIRGYTDLLHSQLTTDQSDYLKLVKPILESSHNMTLLLDDLLNLSKLDHLDKIEKEKIDVKQITMDVVAELEPIILMRNKRIITRFEIETIKADRSSLVQILRNLIVNAVRYSGDSSNSEVIEVIWKTSDHAHFVELQVKDNGAGIPKEHQDRIFERFYRIDKGRHRSQGGSGLGLALVKHHTTNHGGQVGLISEPGQGCCFVSRFPE